jgi:hypothetical protein
MTEPDSDSIAMWADRIRSHMARTVEAIVATGRELVDAKAAVGHGNWLPLLQEVGISARTAQMFMLVANSPLANACHARILPPGDVTALYTLAGLPGEVIEKHIADGKITPDTSRRDLYPLIHAQEMEDATARREADDHPAPSPDPEPETPTKDKSIPRAKKVYAVTWHPPARRVGARDTWPQWYSGSRSEAIGQYKKAAQAKRNGDVAIYEAVVMWRKVDDVEPGS